MYVSVEQLKKESNQQDKILNPRKEDKKLIFADESTIKSEEKPLPKSLTIGNILAKEDNLIKRKEMISAISFEPAEFAFERAIGKNDSLYSNFTELIALTKRKVGRIVIKEDNKKTGYATGFMVSNSLMLTNWHVFRNQEMAVESEIQFFYEYDVHGHPITPVIFKLETNKFFQADKTLDYCFIAVQQIDVTGKVPLESIGYLYLDKSSGKIGDVNVEKLNIIHHPQGDYKQISIRENLFVGVDETKIFYETDTAQGSSGSPVFNDQWQVVGLHHRSIAKMSEDEKDYLDKDNKIIPIIDGKIDVSKVIWLKNEGMRISVILNHLSVKNPNNDLVASLAVPEPPEYLNFVTNKKDNPTKYKDNNSVMENSNKNITVSIPPDVLSNDHSINISLSTNAINPIINVMDKKIIADTPNIDELLLEVSKADKEEAVDFSKCKGYDAMFLGTTIPLPQPKKALEKQIALLKNKKPELKYFKYSVIFNAVTKMPIISAINVEGDSLKRLDNSKRKDDWLRDKRIDLEIQLTDKFYAKSNFEKGHMSRFEDANWDDTEEDALRNGLFTCFYSNACPQVKSINGPGGLWGKLEKAVLEKGIKKEKGRLGRMTVFNGPIFSEDKNRIFKGVTIPMEYFKIILWLNDDKKLKATAFKLSQETLVDNVRFDESMRIEEEALDIDKDIVFKNYQCSIKSLSELTKIDFEFLEKYDTFKSTNGNEEIVVMNENTIIL